MRSPGFAMGLLVGSFMVAAGTLGAQPVLAAETYCPNPAHGRPAKPPAELLPSLATAFQIDASEAHDATYVRCVGRRLMGCYVGANLDCFKANTHRALPGASAWCRDNPDATDIPMAATGHDTIYEWSCKGGRAVAGKAVMKVDLQGYIANNWREIH